jgi:hypothetical protein
MVRHKPRKIESLRALWEVSRQIPTSQDARAYWDAIDRLLLKMSGAQPQEWTAAVALTKMRLARQAAEQIAFWEREKERIRRLTREAATQSLIKALKIDGKIAVISKNLVELEESTETFES